MNDVDYEVGLADAHSEIDPAYSLNTSDSNLMAAHDESFLRAAHRYDEIQSQGGNYYNMQYSDVTTIEITYNVSAPYSLVAYHQAGYAWRGSNPNKPLPPKP